MLAAPSRTGSQHYDYFSTALFRIAEIRNHNTLLSSVDGVDGIKTGYIHESRFNIVASVRRGGRHIVAVVFGGRTAARDARMCSLIDNNINVASLKRTSPPVVEGFETAEARAKDVKETPPEAKEKVAVAAPALHRDEPAPGSTDPIKPNAVKTFAVQLGSIHTASLLPLPSGNSRKLMPAPATASPITVTNVAIAKRDAASPAAKPGNLGVLPAKLASASENVPVAAALPEPAAKPRSGGWIVGRRFPGRSLEAKQRLTAAQEKAKAQLGRADPFTERTTKGDKALFRARFAGLDKDGPELPAGISSAAKFRACC